MFIPYTGPTGPTQQQAEANTKALAEAAGAELIWLPRSEGDGDEAWAEKDGRTVIYDRWGFCGGDGDGGEGLDQASFDEALAYLS